MRGSARLPLVWVSDGSDLSDWSYPSDWSGTQSPKRISDWSAPSDQSDLSDLQYNKAVS